MAYASETCVIVIRSTENRTEGSLGKFLGQLAKKYFILIKNIVAVRTSTTLILMVLSMQNLTIYG